MVAPLLLGWLLAQTVKPPRPVHRPEPSYSDEARQAGVQGNVLVHLTVDEHGKPRDIEILSPLGFGLDERAIRAIEQWRFEPARQNGQPVSMEAQIEVSFRFQDAWFDRKQEELRQAYNATVAQLSKSGLEEKRQAALIKSLETLSGKKYPPAQAALGSFLLRGQYGLAPDPVRGDELIRQAAKKHNGPALADWGQLRIQQGALEEGLALLRDAAVHGAESAQYVLGRRYETGDGVPRELDRARRYYRLCAMRQTGACQLALARLLNRDPAAPARDRLQAIAWYELAAALGEKAAATEVQPLVASLGEFDRKQVDAFKRSFTQPLR